MSFDKAEKIARAVLYEGYMLYPYRASALKNRQRCGFGTLYPEQHPAVLNGAEPCRNRTECLLIGDPSTRVKVQVRFLHMLDRRIEQHLPGGDLEFQPVEAVVVDDQIYSALEEAVERQVSADLQIAQLLDHTDLLNFEFPATKENTELHDRAGKLAGRMTRIHSAVAGRIQLKAERVAEPANDNLFRLCLEVSNCTAATHGPLPVLASAHTLLRIEGGAFISALDAPAHLREATAACCNIGTYPVLIGEPGEHEVLLSSPIILYDYPQIAPESTGDFFDATEIDELLTLRVMTLTDDEKREMRNADDRTRQLLERTESTAREQMMRMHGTLRNLRPVKDEVA